MSNHLLFSLDVHVLCTVRVYTGTRTGTKTFWSYWTNFLLASKSSNHEMRFRVHIRTRRYTARVRPDDSDWFWRQCEGNNIIIMHTEIVLRELYIWHVLFLNWLRCVCNSRKRNIRAYIHPNNWTDHIYVMIYYLWCVKACGSDNVQRCEWCAHTTIYCWRERMEKIKLGVVLTLHAPTIIAVWW